MWRIARLIRKTIPTLVCLTMAGTSTPGFAQEPLDPADTPDTPAPANAAPQFIEIELSPEGVVAYDSSGGEWIYDFDQGRFLEGGRGRDVDTDGRETAGRNEAAEPVEDRCTEEKIVDYPALRAVWIGEDEYVDGNILASGRVTVKGWVKGDVQSLNKTVLVTSTGQVDGYVRAPEIEVKEGGVVLGELIETRGYDIPVDVIRTQFSSAGLWVVFGFTLALTLIVFLASSLAPRQMGHLTGCALSHPGKSVLMGLLFVILMPAIIVLVAFTIVGLLVVWLVPVAYLVAFALGMGITGSQLIGPLMRRYTGVRLGPMATSLAGVLAFMAVWLVVALLLGADGPGASGYYGFGVFLLVVAIVGMAYPLMIGTGAAVLTRFGFRPYVARADLEAASTETAPAPAPPPIPEGPSPVRRTTVQPPVGPTPPEGTGGDQSGPLSR